ncbi:MULTISPECIES: MFS transporter [unclassified Siphonobacter]|uniref:MFS transporter n=1 Tax=unclassified Siphonobacter TaxID=2635712 RepID=UPI000CC06654|nr:MULTISPECIES: MFS transporter [unclassified Siphonobacter]MDQ1088329.1 putative MFS transporter [Siphonobacter sp. SORGH_AS_1065]PKK37762.1 MFS transporter [Siphonobacter sp. SORGH_AS_0500]
MSSSSSLTTSTTRSAYTIILVAALGYFVDVYDLILFGVIRNPSLLDLGVPENQLLAQGTTLFNWQMAGMLLGGIFWGVIGDKKGRKSVLFGSILMYSLANAINGLISDLTIYAVLRFIAGVGLAGELGAGITLINETMPKEKRGYGTLIVAGFGASGAVFAALLPEFIPNWRILYFIGGGLGLALLTLRIGTYESGLFEKAEHSNVKKGDFLSLFTDQKRFKKYLACIFIGIPIWYVISVLVLSAPELVKALGIQHIRPNLTIAYLYAGLSIGDLVVGLISQQIRSRKKAIYLYLSSLTVLVVYYMYSQGLSSQEFYWLCFVLGFFAGYWAMFVTMSSEQFGTNLRATVTTTIPNFVRGAVIPISLLFKSFIPSLGLIGSALTVGLVCLGLAFLSNWSVEETFGKELDYLE